MMDKEHKGFMAVWKCWPLLIMEVRYFATVTYYNCYISIFLTLYLLNIVDNPKDNVIR